ncbi:MAG: magnesium chelatase subunit H [Chloroflexota bacterium]
MMRFIFLTMDGNHASALKDAARQIQQQHKIDVQLILYNATDLQDDESQQKLSQQVNQADFIFGSMLFGEDFIRPLQRILEASETPICIITSNPALIRCTQIGSLAFGKKDTDKKSSMLKRWMNKFRPKKGHGENKRQLSMLRNIGKILKFIPGKMQDLHTYIVVHDYWLHASPENIKRMLELILSRYGGYDVTIQEPIHYPDVAICHPDAEQPFPDLVSYRQWQRKNQPYRETVGTVGLLSLRTVLLSGNVAHLQALITELEAHNLEVITAYSAGLDFRPAIDEFFKDEQGNATVDVLLNGVGFSLVGGMAESRPEEAREALEALNVGYIDMIPLAFQKVESWEADDVGLLPMQMAMNIAIPELDGAAEPLVYGGPTAGSDKFIPIERQVTHASRRIANRVKLNRKQNQDKKISIVLFNFPPNLGNIGTAAYLDVFVSLYRLLTELRDSGYAVELPSSADELRQMVVEGNAMQFGTDGNVGARLSLEDYRQLFPEYVDIENFWGYAPGEHLNDGRDFYILGQEFGNVFVGIQPGFGYERDPMRLLMAKDAAPHHGFAAFYTWLEHIFCTDAVVHFGTHGAMEFMPGKQAGMSVECWSTRLLGGLPNFYYYSVNNPSEGTIAKRRGLATLISYMVPPLQQAGLYKGLRLLKQSIDSYHAKPSSELLQDIRMQAENIGVGIDVDFEDADAYITALKHELIEVEHRMIPMGLHILGETPQSDEIIDIFALVTAFTRPEYGRKTLNPLPQLIAEGLKWDYEHLRKTIKYDSDSQAKWQELDCINRDVMRLFMTAPRHPKLDNSPMDDYLMQRANIPHGQLNGLWLYLDDLLQRMTNDNEVNGLLSALEGQYIPPSPGNDVVRNGAVVPTGRNIHGLDPFHVPTPAAHIAGEQLVGEMIERLVKEQGGIPETIAFVLWGIDNLKSDCEGVAQVLALVGARAITDELGKVSDVELIPLSELGRPRIDVVVTVSGIFRDLLHHQMELLDKAIRMATEADEPSEFNFVRKHSLMHADSLNVSLHEAATRVFSNAPGSYGANVNHLVDSSNWESDDELGEAFMARKSFTYGKHGQWRDSRDIMEASLSTVDAAFQNIDSFEIGISDVDHYYEYLGGTAKSVEKLTGKRPPVLVADAISLTGRLSSLEQMVRLESRTKLLNPKWYDAMLKHGYEGVSEIETRVSNTYGWSATADAVEGWVYQDIADTFLLDEQMRQRMSEANPHATASITKRLLEANSRGFWDADENIINHLREIYGNLEDVMEGVVTAST